MSVTSWKSAGTVASDSSVGSASWDSDDFATPLVGNEVSSDNGVYAGAMILSSTVTNYLKSTNFGFTSGDVPLGATINGFEIEVRQYRVTTPAVVSTLVKFVKTGSVVGSDIGTAVDWATTETATTYGNSTELGGQSWTQSDVTASNFGCVLSVTNASTRFVPITRNVLVDQVRMRIYYDASNATVNLSTSTATATLLSVTQNHGYQVTIGLNTASGTEPNLNVSAGSQTSIGLTTASANTNSPTISAGSSPNLSLFTASANTLALTQSHGSSYTMAVQTATGQTYTIIPSLSVFLTTSTANALENSIVENHGSSQSLSLFTAIATSTDPSGVITGNTSRRIIITCS